MPGQKQTTSAQLPLRTPSLSEVEKQPLGKAAIEKLSAAGSDPTSLEISVGFVVLTRMIPVMRIPDLKGFSRKSLSRIPQELRSTATILERIRDNPFYNAALEKSVPGLSWNTTIAELRKYADVLESLTREVRASMRQNPREWDLRLISRRKLIANVVRDTGEPHYNWVADLLNAAYAAASIDPCEEASNLRHLWETQVKRKAKHARYRKMARMMAS